MRCLKGLALLSSSYIVVSIVLMYRAMRTQLQPFCTTAECNRSCHQVHRRNQEPSAPSVSVSVDFLKAKRNLSHWNYFFVEEIGTKSEPVLTTNDNSGIVFRTSLSTPKRAITLEEIIELARRKVSHNYEEPLSQKHYVTVDDDKLPVEEPAIQVSEIVKNNEWTNGDWAYLEQLMELDADRISPSSEPPITIDNDDDTAVAADRQCTFFMGLK
ncbi:hypothetical protein LOAG_08649 [Loa loa]|uniref:Uncharacterized protein n=2 Tax=Loa loa TaxID=7209 RepID=A0A1S0TTK5_LOALO|nr:hypothetical protein LOAG_08649 [Loa loa]EFO19844.2 hypothetical protein LOAG_08649 [Loa loa]